MLNCGRTYCGHALLWPCLTVAMLTVAMLTVAMRTYCGALLPVRQLGGSLEHRVQRHLVCVRMLLVTLRVV